MVASTRLRLLLGAALIASAAPARTQTPVAVPGSEQFTVKGRNGVDYEVQVWLPPGLDTMTTRPPAFFFTDGNLAFHIAHQTYAMLAIAGEVSPLIIVGVGYPQTDGRGYTPSYVVNRTRDYTPTNIAEMPGGGGSAAFLAFLKDELVPRIETRFRADPTRRGLGGHSLGGLFATYALLHEPGFFTRYWLGSPSLWWDRQVAFSWVAAAKAGPTQPTGRAYLTVGAEETDVMVPPMRRMAVALERNFPTLHVGSQVYSSESHTSVVGSSISRAMRFLYGDFGRRTVAMSPATRAAFAGDWTSPAFTVRLRPAPTGMSMSFETSGQTMTVLLKPASRDTIFTAGGLTAQFVALRDATGKVTSLRGTMLGATQEYTRARK